MGQAISRGNSGLDALRLVVGEDSEVTRELVKFICSKARLRWCATGSCSQWIRCIEGAAGAFPTFVTCGRDPRLVRLNPASMRRGGEKMATCNHYRNSVTLLTST